MSFTPRDNVKYEGDASYYNNMDNLEETVRKYAEEGLLPKNIVEHIDKTLSAMSAFTITTDKTKTKLKVQIDFFYVRYYFLFGSLLIGLSIKKLREHGLKINPDMNIDNCVNSLNLKYKFKGKKNKLWKLSAGVSYFQFFDIYSDYCIKHETTTVNPDIISNKAMSSYFDLTEKVKYERNGGKESEITPNFYVEKDFYNGYYSKLLTFAELLKSLNDNGYALE